MPEPAESAGKAPLAAANLAGHASQCD